MVFSDRAEAGIALAEALITYKENDPLVVGLPNGGVVTAHAVSKILHIGLDILVAKKITHPWATEYAIGAVTEMGSPIWSIDGLRTTTQSWRNRQALKAQNEAREAHMKYLGIPEPSHFQGRTILLVDDGAATGLSMMAAVAESRQLNAEKIVIAVPVAPPGVLDDVADELIVLHAPTSRFDYVGRFYFDFDQVADAEVVRLLRDSRKPVIHESFDLESLNDVLAGIEEYPASSGLLAKTARDVSAASTVVDFFEALPSGALFQTKQDVIDRAMLLTLLIDSEHSEARDTSLPGD